MQSFQCKHSYVFINKLARSITDDCKRYTSGEFLSNQTILVRVSKQIRDRLAQRGEYGDSMNSIIKKLLEDQN